MAQMREYEQLHEKKIHSDSFFPYNTYICTIPLDFTRVPPHWHDDVELIVIQSGQGIVNVDTISYGVKAGDIIVVRPGQIHSIYQAGGYIMEYENIIFQPTLLNTAASDLCTGQFFDSYLNRKYELPVLLDSAVKNYKELNECIQQIDQYCHKTPINYQMMIKSYLYQFFYLFAQGEESLVVSENRKNLGKIKQVIRYVETHYSEEITIELVAKELGFSSSHFMKFFKKNMHVTFTSYLNDYRLNRGSELLKDTDYPIAEIMERVGYNNLSYFNRQFKEYFQMTPREYRKNQNTTIVVK